MPALRHPSAVPVPWVFARKGDASKIVVVERQFYYGARIEAARRLGCHVDQVVGFVVTEGESVEGAKKRLQREIRGSAA